MLCPRVSSRGLVFLVSLFFLVFLEFFWFLDSEAFIGYRAEKKTKKTRRIPKKPKKPKKTKSREKCCAQGFPPGDWFFWFLWFFWFSSRRKRSSATGLRKKQKNSKNTKKTKETKKTKVLGEMLCPRVSSRGLVFLVSLVFFGFLRVFWFLIYEFVWHISDIITKTNIFWCYNNFLGGTKTKATISTERALCEQQNPQ